jgi:hypothetical protein
MTRFIFFDKDNEHISVIIETEDPLTKAGKFPSYAQNLFNEVLSGELGSKVLIERLEVKRNENRYN